MKPLEPLLPGETRSEYIARVDTPPRSQERAKLAYETFRDGLRCPADIPAWNNAPSWIRDAIIVAYLQGTLDGGER